MTENTSLREKALRATKGPWQSAGGYLTVRDPERGSFTTSIYHMDEMGQKTREAPFQAIPFSRPEDAAYIAAADPETILGMLDASEAKDRCIEALEADKAELKKQLAAERKPDFFWDYNDPECSYDSPDEAIAQADMGSVVRLFTGKSLPQIWATTRVLTVDENGDWDDHEVAVFDNEADAKRCWPENLEAARAALSGKEGQS